MSLDYEYKDGRYSKAVNNVKAALFDILAVEKSKTTNLEKELKSASEEDKDAIEKKLAEQKENLDKIVSNVDDIVLSIEKLDSINIKLSNIDTNDLAKAVSDVGEESVNEAFNEDLKNIDDEKKQVESDIKEKVDEVVENTDLDENKKQELEDNTNIVASEDEEEPTLKISLEEENDEEESTDEGEESSEVEDNEEQEEVNTDIEIPVVDGNDESDTDEEESVDTDEDENEEDVDLDIEIPVVDNNEADDKELDEAIKSVDNQLEAAQKIDEEMEKVPKTELTSEKLAFTKENKNVIKAILVKQTQLNNLKASREKQKQIVSTLGLFSDYSYLKNTQNALEGSLKAKEKIDIKIDVNADKERQIEDLMVKASVYTSEGDTEMAQAIYDKINELNTEDIDVEGEEKGVEKVKAS